MRLNIATNTILIDKGLELQFHCYTNHNRNKEHQPCLLLFQIYVMSEKQVLKRQTLCTTLLKIRIISNAYL